MRLILGLALVCLATTAYAQTAPAQPDPAAGQPLPPALPPPPPEEIARAHFSGKRLAIEILAGEAVTIGTSLALCSGPNSCPGDGWLAFGVDFAATPLAVWGVGSMMGGQGTLLASYLGASPAVTPLSMPGSPNESPGDTLSRIQIEATIAMIILPATSALLYEVSSQIVSAKWQREHAPALALRPLLGRASGAVASVGLRF